jgi:hypothetical protein
LICSGLGAVALAVGILRFTITDALKEMVSRTFIQMICNPLTLSDNREIIDAVDVGNPAIVSCL